MPSVDSLLIIFSDQICSLPHVVQPFPERVKMPAEYSCPTCNETFEEETVEAVILRASQHNHQHHGGPVSLTPELEAALRATVVEH